MQIRTMQTGLPTTTIVPFGEVTMDPDQITTTEFGTIATRFNFPSPVFLEGGGTEYALTLYHNLIIIMCLLQEWVMKIYQIET